MLRVTHKLRAALAVALLTVVLTMHGQTHTLPVVNITTQDNQAITSKTVYVPGTYFIVDSSNPDMNVGSQDEPVALEIRGRGHSSWKGNKKPYKLRLAEKTSLLGMNRHRHWALLKFYEPTVAGLQLGRLMGMDWTASTRPVEVVLNGEYIGMYLLTETNRISTNRLDIYEQPDNNEDESTIPYGWLVEIDNYKESNQISIRENSRWNLLITYHSPELLSAAQKEWLITEFKDITEAIYAEDKSDGRWQQLIDADAMARYFIVQEVMDNSDGFHGSFYLHKDSADDARWVAGPLWDLSCGQRKKTDYTFRMKTSYGFTPHWIGQLVEDETFCAAVKAAWEDFYPYELQAWMNYIDEQLLVCGEAFEQEKRRWNYSSSETLNTRVEKLKAALLANAEWFNENLPTTLANAVDEPRSTAKKVIKVEYINMSGMRSTKPWKGINIKEITYGDNSRETIKLHK